MSSGHMAKFIQCIRRLSFRLGEEEIEKKGWWQFRRIE